MSDIKPTKVALADLKPWAGNPRQISDRDMQMLKASLREHGMVTTVVARQGSLDLVGGHQRVAALKEMAAEGEGVPKYVYATLLKLSDKEASRLNVSLNAVSGEFDQDLLGRLIQDLDGFSSQEALAMGFETEELDSLIASMGNNLEEEAARLEQEAKDLGSFARSVTLTVEFETVELRDQAKDALKIRAKDQGCKSGTILSKLLETK